MKNLLFILLFICFSKTFSQSDKSLIYTNNDVKIELKIENEKFVLKHNIANPIIMRFENLDPTMIACSGLGLRILKATPSDKNETLWEINLANLEEKISVYKLTFSYKKNDEFYHGFFEIQVE